MKISLKKKMAAAAAAATIAGGAGIALAYWTTTGSGTGSATAGTDSAVTVAQVGATEGLYPGGSQPVNFKITNGAAHNQYVASVAVSISDVSGPGITPTTPCTAADFTLVQPDLINQDLVPGDTTFSPSGASIAMVNSSTNQDGCKNATVSLAFLAS